MRDWLRFGAKALLPFARGPSVSSEVIQAGWERLRRGCWVGPLAEEGNELNPPAAAATLSPPESRDRRRPWSVQDNCGSPDSNQRRPPPRYTVSGRASSSGPPAQWHWERGAAAILKREPGPLRWLGKRGGRPSGGKSRHRFLVPFYSRLVLQGSSVLSCEGEAEVFSHLDNGLVLVTRLCSYLARGGGGRSSALSATSRAGRQKNQQVWISTCYKKRRM